MYNLWQVLHVILDAAFVIVRGGVVGLLFCEVFYCIGASESYSYVCVFE
jgi:hypothetical protein